MWLALGSFSFLGVEYARGEVVPEPRVRGRTAGLRARASEGLCAHVQDPPGWEPWGEPGALVRRLPPGWELAPGATAPAPAATARTVQPRAPRHRRAAPPPA